MTVADEPLRRVVLDTNVLLDWLVFEDPGVVPIAAAVQAGRVRWISCLSMRAEFERTLGYEQLARWSPDVDRALAVFDRFAETQTEPTTLPLLRCTDPSDQVFLDLAITARCTWLITHDRAVLRLARQARRYGLTVVCPSHWAL